MKKFIFSILVLTSKMNAQDDLYNVDGSSTMRSVQCSYYMNMGDVYRDSAGRISTFKVVNNEDMSNATFGEYKFKNKELKNSLLFREIAIMQCGASRYINMTKLDRELGYSLIRKHDTITYVHSFHEYMKNKAGYSGFGVSFGLVGALAGSAASEITKKKTTYLILDSDYRIKQTLSFDDLKSYFKSLDNKAYWKQLKEEPNWNFPTALKYYQLLKNMELK